MYGNIILTQVYNLIAQLGENKVSRRMFSYRNTLKKQLRHGPPICIDARTIHVNVICNLHNVVCCMRVCVYSRTYRHLPVFFFLNKNIYRGFIEGPKRTSASSSICMYVYMYVCSVLACVLHRHIDIYIIERSRQRLSVNVDGALPSVGSVVP